MGWDDKDELQLNKSIIRDFRIKFNKKRKLPAQLLVVQSIHLSILFIQPIHSIPLHHILSFVFSSRGSSARPSVGLPSCLFVCGSTHVPSFLSPIIHPLFRQSVHLFIHCQSAIHLFRLLTKNLQTIGRNTHAHSGIHPLCNQDYRYMCCLCTSRKDHSSCIRQLEKQDLIKIKIDKVVITKSLRQRDCNWPHSHPLFQE